MAAISILHSGFIDESDIRGRLRPDRHAPAWRHTWFCRTWRGQVKHDPKDQGGDTIGAKTLWAHACVAATRISPFLGVARLCMTPMSSAASARASSVCGTCTFISSPSKSALYGAHTHSLKRNVLRARGIALVS